MKRYYLISYIPGKQAVFRSKKSAVLYWTALIYLSQDLFLSQNQFCILLYGLFNAFIKRNFRLPAESMRFA